jgi:hypothetical protein
MLTNVDKMLTKKVPKSSEIFVCQDCDYSTSRRSQYDRHLLTAKHQNVDNVDKNVDKKVPKSSKKLCKEMDDNGEKYQCLCGKLYKHRQSLSLHKKKCDYKMDDNGTDIKECNQKITTSLVMELIKQNKNLQEMLCEQHNKMVEIVKDNKTITTNNTNNNTTNNNHFNLNLFLNETCKDAINMTDFIDSLNVKLKDLEYTAKTSYAEGISKIFINGLISLNVPDRPIHCSDFKRDIIYIKDDNIWEKDDENKTKLTKAIKIVGHKNMKQISEWQKVYPEYNDPESKQNDNYMKMLCNAMSGSTKEESEKNYEKIIKNIVKEVVIDKDIFR